ncbi:hypothetical protein V6N13_059304 [Hibiscus sabdariffa]|uniref:Uncharacterized protein n=1 Tax=Hibiscus sabdariffa TaxID=183260 RepID=A0ABR2GEA8_9ROSI
MVFASGSVVSSIVGFLRDLLWVELNIRELVVSVPKVVFPQFSNQAANAKFIANVWGNGVRVSANEEGVVECDFRLRVSNVVWVWSVGGLSIVRLGHIDNGLGIGFEGDQEDWCMWRYG